MFASMKVCVRDLRFFIFQKIGEILYEVAVVNNFEIC